MNTKSQNILLENQRIVWSLANKYATIRTPAEELFQIGCVKACRCLDEYDSTKGSIANFLHDRLRGVMRHAVSRQYTIDNRERSGNDIAFMENHSNIRSEIPNKGDVKCWARMYNACEEESTCIDFQFTLWCMRCDGTLTQTEYLIVKLIFWHEKTHRQIGHYLDISQARVAYLRKRALRKIRRRLECIDGTKHQSADKKTAAIS